MATRGFLIRFIDIGLIVLFGFLMISDIETSSRVELAGSREAEEPAEPDDDRSFVLVRIDGDGTFVVGMVGSEDAAVPNAAAAEGAADVDPRTDEAVPPRVRVTTVADLEDEIRRLADRNDVAGRETVVLIEPHPASTVQRTVDAMDVSDRLGLQKSFRMDIEVAPPDSLDRGGAP